MTRLDDFPSADFGGGTTERALRLLGKNPGTYLLGVDALAVTVTVGGLLASAVLPVPTADGFALAVALAGGIATAGRHVPRMVVAARRKAAVGEAPVLVNRAVARMRVEPTAEAAAAFAAREGEGPLAERLGEHVRRARGTPRSGLERFADEWAADAPELGRACSLLTSAAAAPADERDEVLDRTLDAALDGARERAENAAARLTGPVTAVYAFGVLLPLALVAGLPAAGVAGLPVTATGIVLVYDLLLPLGLCVASALLLARRPVESPAVAVPRSHPSVSARHRPALVVGTVTVAAAVGWVCGGFVAGWTRPLATVGAAVGAGLIVWFHPQRAVRERIRELESGLPDALYAVGRGVRQGHSVEGAIEGAACDLDGPVAAMLADAARHQRVLGVGVSTAFLGEYGVLASVPSSRARSVARLFALAANGGRPTGTALVSMGSHFDDLQTVERDVRRAVRDATATMGNTAAVFAPLIGGVTVALADRVAGGSLGAAGVSTSTLGAAVGWYVLVLAAILTALATGLERGFDRAVVGYRVGLAVPAATGVYLAAYVAGGLVA